MIFAFPQWYIDDVADSNAQNMIHEAYSELC